MTSRKATTDRGFSSLTAAHEKICASFLGPKAENHQILFNNFASIAGEILEARELFFPNDPSFIDDEIRNSESFVGQVQKIEDYLAVLSKLLAKHCIPFFSPRYNGHMVSDASLPSYLGYLVGMLWNQNNVTPEASPITSHVEYLVGQQICKMLGYGSVDSVHPGVPTGWGHITCDGSVANLESFWVARNIKFYPLSLLLAVTEGALSFVADTFETMLCTGEMKKFAECSAWELLNLTVDEVLDLPTRLVNDYGISTTFIEGAVGKYLIATTGTQELEQRFKIKPPQAMVSVANHYSWPKSASVTGIGIDNIIHIHVTTTARMDTEHLKECLEQNLKDQRAVFTIIAIMGTTEHGAIDPLLEILLIRKEFQQRGLSFYVHADAAWGGYFASMIPPDVVTSPARLPASDLILQQPLSEYSRNQLTAIRLADSCTIDPHKAGFAPYPAGCLCYRDERSRFMVTMTAAYINTTADVDTVGTYGVEGSKPGAAPTSVWLAHHTIGLDHTGYGALLGEAMFTSVKLYANWATMTFEEPNLIVKTLVLLPSEQKGLPPTDVEKEIRFIIENIVNKENSEILNNEEAMAKIRELGGDLIIIVFACNFHIGGVVNEDITEANFLNRRMFERFSVTSRDDDPYTRELIVGSTILDQESYGVALEKYKERLGLKGDGDVTVMTLVPMSPFPTAHNLVKSFADTFKAAALDEIEECYTRIVPSPAQHSFVMQGTDQLFLSSMSVFNIGSYRQQTIVTGTLPADTMTVYVEAVEKNPSALFTLTTEKALLSTILYEKSCKVTIYQGLNTGIPTPIAKEVELTNVDVIVNRSIAPQHLDSSWPEFMPFYLYGTTSQYHIDHMLVHSPNTQLSSARVTVALDDQTTTLPQDGSRLIAIANTTRENAMQPFSADHLPTFFAAESKIPVTIYVDLNGADASGPGLLNDLGTPIAQATVTLSPSIFIDYTLVNQEHGVAVSTKTRQKVPGLPDLSTHIDIPTVGERYNITPIDMAAVLNGLVPARHADEYERKLANKKGWRDELEEALEKKELARI